MLFTDRRSSVILETEHNSSVNGFPHKEPQESLDSNYEDKEQVTRRLSKKAKDTFKRVRTTFSIPGRHNSGEAIEMKTYDVGDNKQLSENRVHKRSKSEQFGIENEAKLKKGRRLTFEFEPENFRRVKIPNPKRRFSSCNIMKGNLDGSRQTTTHGLYIKNRPSISKHSLAPVTTSLAQNSSKTLYHHSSISRKRRIKSSGNLDDNDNTSIFKDTSCEDRKTGV